MTIMKLALRGIRASLGRLILTTIAIVAGVGFVGGSFILADSLKDTFSNLVAKASAGTDAQIQVKDPEFGQSLQTLPDSLIATVAALPEVKKATPLVAVDNEQNFHPFVVLNAAGEKVLPKGPPTVTLSWDGTTGQFFTGADGTPPQGVDQVALDRTQAEAAGVKVGDRITMLGPEGEGTYTLTSVVDPAVSGGAYFVLFDFPSAQKLFGKVGQVDQIVLTRASGVSTDQLIESVSKVVPAGAEVLNQSQVVDNQQAQFERIINAIRNFLLGFAGIALFVSLFIIYNTFAILVSQRLQQIGMLRAIGATRAQIRRLVLVEAFGVGVIGSIIGIGFGLLVAVAIKGLLKAGGGFPDTRTIVAGHTIVACLLVGVVATALSALLPAVLAGRVSPVSAMRLEAPARASVTRKAVIGGGLLGLGLILLAVGLFVNGQGTPAVLLELIVGVLASFIGVALLSGLFAGPAVDLIGRPWVLGTSLLALGLVLPILHFTVGKGVPDGPLGWIGFVIKAVVSLTAMATGASILVSAARGGKATGPGGAAAGLQGRLARQNAARAPQRTAATATALTIGVALVSTVSVVGQSFKATSAATLKRAIKADLFIYDDQGGSPFPAELADRVEKVPGIEAVGRFRLNQVRIDSTDKTRLAAFNTGVSNSLVDFNLAQGSIADLHGPSVLVYRDIAQSRGLTVGSQLNVQFPDLQVEQLTVAGVFDDNSVLNSPLVVDLPLYQKHVPATNDQYAAAKLAPGADLATVKAAVAAITKEYASVTVKDTAEFQKQQEDQIDKLIAFINYLLAFALFVAFLGVINTIVLSVIERTREIGLLRAVGMTQDQVRSTIRWESVIVCLFGAVLGIVLGVLFAFAAVTAIPRDVISTIGVPWETIAFAILAAALAGIVAAVLPARRAARLNILNAITTPGT